jgi:hypothetical protein
MPVKEGTRDYTDNTRNTREDKTLTSSGESTDSWASRKISASFNFFDRLVLRDTGIFLIGALGAFEDFTAGSASGIGGSLAVISSAEGAVVASLFGSSSSLQRKAKGNSFFTTQKGKIASTTKS